MYSGFGFRASAKRLFIPVTDHLQFTMSRFNSRKSLL
jgi:hypothetical protein